MKTPEQAAEEYANANGLDSSYDVHFLAGHAAGLAEGKSIWRKPSERPEIGKRILILQDKCRLSQMLDAHSNIYWPGIVAWCYVNELTNILPDWATSQQKEGE